MQMTNKVGAAVAVTLAGFATLACAQRTVYVTVNYKFGVQWR